jgi:hypothetical protein
VKVRELSSKKKETSDLSLGAKVLDIPSMIDMLQKGYRYLSMKTLFTAEICTELAKLLAGKQYFFWSDIRTSGSDNPNDLDILSNMAEQLIWCHTLSPAVAMLKFRLPYWDSPETVEETKSMRICREWLGIDFIRSYKEYTLPYPSGKHYLQCWAGKTTETRLVTSDFTNLRIYYHKEYEEKMFYYNIVIRSAKYHNKHFNKKYGFDMCCDCSQECDIISLYESKYGVFCIDYWLDNVQYAIGKGLLPVEGEHGKMF